MAQSKEDQQALYDEWISTALLEEEPQVCIDETVLGASNEEADKEALYNEWISMASAQQQDEGGASAATVIHGSVSPAKKGGGAPQVTNFNDCEKSHKHDVQDALLNHTHEQCAT